MHRAITEVNGRSGGLAVDAHDRLFGPWRSTANGRIQTTHSIANPDKLRRLAPGRT